MDSLLLNQDIPILSSDESAIVKTVELETGVLGNGAEIVHNNLMSSSLAYTYQNVSLSPSEIGATIILDNNHSLGSVISEQFSMQPDNNNKKKKKKKYQARRRAIKLKTRFAILERDGFMCIYCGKNGTEGTLHVDHVVPVSKGGETTEDNLVTACVECNLGKHGGIYEGAIKHAKEYV